MEKEFRENLATLKFEQTPLNMAVFVFKYYTHPIIALMIFLCWQQNRQIISVLAVWINLRQINTDVF